MSEFQYYEFQTLDRRLTPEEQKAVRKLSSHITVSPTRASVEYSWGDFKHDPQQVVAQYFDAMLYTTNWGTYVVIFRFPKAAVDVAHWQPYLYPNAITLDTEGDFVVLTLDLSQEEGGDYVEVDGMLSGIAPVREDLLRGDLRALYLAWLQAAMLNPDANELPDNGSFDDEFEDDDEAEDEDYVSYRGGSFQVKVPPDLTEPPVPPNLQKLSPALQDFISFFQISPDLIKTAAEASAKHATPANNLADQIPRLSDAEKDDFLARLLRGEQRLDLALATRLRDFQPFEPATPKGTRRTIQSILDGAEKLEQERIAEEKRARQAEHARKMQALAPQEAQLWAEVYENIERKTTKGYDRAIVILAELKALAEYQQREAEFTAKIGAIQAQYSRLNGLLHRLSQLTSQIRR